MVSACTDLGAEPQGHDRRADGVHAAVGEGREETREENHALDLKAHVEEDVRQAHQ